MKKNPFKDKTEAELTALLAEKREELRTLRFTGAGSRLKNPNAPHEAKRDVARILTEMTARKTA